MTAVAYIRRSHSGEAQASEAMQRETVVRLAAENGETINRTFKDWGRSGGDRNRPEYMAMLAACEAGDVSTIYCYDQDRLARSNLLFAMLLDSADQHGFRVITTAGEITDDDRRDFAEMRGVMDGGELRKITKRNRANLQRMKTRGDDFGVAPFGYVKKREDGTGRVVIAKVDPDGIKRVIDAYVATGTFSAAANALNDEGFTTHRGKLWHPTQIRQVILREAPELMPNGVRKGTRGPGKPRLFAGLLRCWCGGPMTPGGHPDKPTYYCGRGQRNTSKHPAPYGISERKLMPWIVEEAERLRVPSEVEMDAPGAGYDDEADRRALAALRQRIGETAYLAGIAALDAAREAQGEQRRIIQAVPESVQWEAWSVEDINTVLRSLWHHVELGPDLAPVRAAWRLPPAYVR